MKFLPFCILLMGAMLPACDAPEADDADEAAEARAVEVIGAKVESPWFAGKLIFECFEFADATQVYLQRDELVAGYKQGFTLVIESADWKPKIDCAWLAIEEAAQ